MYILHSSFLWQTKTLADPTLAAMGDFVQRLEEVLRATAH